MEKNTKQKIYKVVMLIILVALITFILTSIFMYKYFGEGTRYLSVSPNDGGISTTLATFKKIIDQKFLGEIDDQKVLNDI